MNQEKPGIEFDERLMDVFLPPRIPQIEPSHRYHSYKHHKHHHEESQNSRSKSRSRSRSSKAKNPKSISGSEKESSHNSEKIYQKAKKVNLEKIQMKDSIEN